jgi:hypothetical protein
MSFTEETSFIPLSDEAVYEAESLEAEFFSESAPPTLAFRPRSKKIWLPFLFPMALCGLSFLLGGIQTLTDIGFGALSLICCVYLLLELRAFPHRMGIGGILLFGGVLVWFCDDYMANWFGMNLSVQASFGHLEELLARTAFFYSLFVLCMVFGLGLPASNRFENCLASIPEPPSSAAYLLILLLMLSVSWSAFLFTADPLPVSLMKAALGPWLNEPVLWTVGRTGNYNTSWGGYVGQLLDIGMMTSIIASVYAVFVARGLVTRTVGWTIWLFWVLVAYGGGRRGQVAFLVLPALAFLYLRFQMRALSLGRRHSIKGYVVVGSLGIVLLAIIQIQGTFRGIGLGNEVDLSKLELTKSQGNLMFTEALAGFYEIPDHVPFFCNRIPGEGALRALPETAFWFIMGPIPRAAWPGKPNDDAMIWYNKLVAGTNGMEGTTIAQGLVGHWYFRFGTAGVIEGGLLVGWLMGVSERLLQRASGRPMTILAAVGLASWLFREYRSFYFIELYGPLIGIGTFILFVRLLRLFGMGSHSNSTDDPAYG